MINIVAGNLSPVKPLGKHVDLSVLKEGKYGRGSLKPERNLLDLPKPKVLPVNCLWICGCEYLLVCGTGFRGWTQLFIIYCISVRTALFLPISLYNLSCFSFDCKFMLHKNGMLCKNDCFGTYLFPNTQIILYLCFFLSGSGYDWGEWTSRRPPGGRATDCNVLWPSASTHEHCDRSMGAGPTGPTGLLHPAQQDPILLSRGTVMHTILDHHCYTTFF